MIYCLIILIMIHLVMNIWCMHTQQKASFLFIPHIIHYLVVLVLFVLYYLHRLCFYYMIIMFIVNFNPTQIYYIPNVNLWDTYHMRYVVLHITLYFGENPFLFQFSLFAFTVSISLCTCDLMIYNTTSKYGLSPINHSHTTQKQTN